MKHEIFKIFKISTDVLNAPAVNDFLKGDVTPKSISLIYLENGGALLSIGYISEKSSHHYHLAACILNGGLDTDTSVLEKEVEDNAKKIGGVVCQDINFYDGKIVVTFLTTK